ncbi:unnamed protein product, partial [Mesorhabditis belari]|uniref:C-type lectin n=1 Tax=Mesorhabditis belari TaxID=2138241 RepID=A0AAF3EAQ6_9BILA
MLSSKLFSLFMIIWLSGVRDVDAVSDQCPCLVDSLWLDVIFVVESTEAVSKVGLQQVELFIETTLMQTTISPSQLRVGVITYADEPQIVADLTTYGSTAELMAKLDIPFLGGVVNDAESALRKATELFQKDHRANVRKVAVLFAASLDTIASMPIEIGNDFREDGGVLIAIEFVSARGAHVPAIRELASEGYVLSTALEQLHSSDLLEALCDANCYCAAGHYPLSNGTRKTPDGGCFLPSDVAAERDQAASACASAHEGAFLPVVNDDQTNDLLFAVNKWSDVQLWLGGKLINGQLQWDNGVKPKSTAFNPIIHKSTATEACLYSKQKSDKKIEWFSGDCSTPQKFVCQSAPLSSKNRLTMQSHAKYRKLTPKTM